MIVLRVSIDANAPMIQRGERQIPFALQKAVNASMITAQQKQLKRMATVFTLRRPQFAKLSVKITKFAKKFDPVGEIAISPPGGRADIFAKFEQGGLKKPRDGHNLAIPIIGSPVKRTKTSIVAVQNRPRILLGGDSQVTDRTGKVRGVKRGKTFGGAFIRPAKDGKPAMIFVRQGKKLKLAYVLEPEAQIKPELDFVETITDSVKRTFSSDFTREFADAVAKSRK
jgi:hypothetical protein